MGNYIFYFMVLLTAFAGLISELLQTHILTITWGGLINQLTLVFSTYIFALGLGAAFTPKQGNAPKQFILLQFSLSLLGLVSPFLLLFINYELSNVMSIIASYFIVFIIGFISGFELPLLFKMKNQPTDAFEKLMTQDYLGMALGCLLFSTVLLKLFGFWKTVFLNSIVNALVGLLTIFLFKKTMSSKESYAHYTIGLSLILVCILSLIKEKSLTQIAVDWVVK